MVKEIWNGLQKEDYRALNLYVKRNKTHPLLKDFVGETMSRNERIELNKKFFQIPEIVEITETFKSDPALSKKILHNYDLMTKIVFDTTPIIAQNKQLKSVDEKTLNDAYKQKRDLMAEELKKIKAIIKNKQIPENDRKKAKTDMQILELDMDNEKVKYEKELKNIETHYEGKTQHEIQLEKDKIEQDIDTMLSLPAVAPSITPLKTDEQIIIDTKLKTETDINPDNYVGITQDAAVPVDRAQHIENKELKKKNIMNTGINNANEKNMKF
jgi:hypothetical protein